MANRGQFEWVDGADDGWSVRFAGGGIERPLEDNCDKAAEDGLCFLVDALASTQEAWRITAVESLGQAMKVVQ